MTRAYYNPLTPVTLAATTEAPGYLAANVAKPSLGRPWRATGTGATDVTITYAATGLLAGVLLHDVNFSTATIKDSVDGTTFSAGTAITTYANKLGRRRGVLLLNLTGKKAWRITIASGTPTDGAAFWRIGAAYGFANQILLPVAHNKGYDVPIIEPLLAPQLANGQEALADTGPHYQTMKMDFLRKYDQNFDAFIQGLRTGIVGLDYGLANFPEQVWPVRRTSGGVPQGSPKANSERFSVMVREVV